MSKIYQFSPEPKDDDQLFVEASEWMAKMDKGLYDEETETLLTWMSTDRKSVV